MRITFKENKDCLCYKAYVENSNNREAIKAFTKRFNVQLMASALKLHKKLINAANAQEYNSNVASDNKLKIFHGPDNQPVELEVRIQQKCRKFLFCIAESNSFAPLIRKNWTGDDLYSTLNHLHVDRLDMNHNH